MTFGDIHHFIFVRVLVHGSNLPRLIAIHPNHHILGGHNLPVDAGFGGKSRGFRKIQTFRNVIGAHFRLLCYTE